MVDVTIAPQREASEEIATTLKGKLDRARTELLDLSTRNRLINVPRGGRAKQVEVVDEVTAEVLRLLVAESKALTFAAGRRAPGETTSTEEEGDEISDLAQPEDDSVDGRGIAQRHSDTKLQTRLTSEGLQKRLLNLFLDARTLQEEQGVNILYLSLGMLKWFEDEKSDKERNAPLILLPVALERGSVGERFKLRWLQEDLTPNLSLAALMKRQFGLELPQFTGGEEAFEPTKYFAKVAAATSGQPRWSVAENDIVLGFFSFAKFLMYRDLDPINWPAGAGLSDHPVVSGLLGDGFGAGEALIGEDDPIDPHIDPEHLIHVVDSDSSQTVAVHEIRRGRNMVVQGPPGTGKSQTIANVIASAVYDGKRVLFCSEKMAALEVVKRRLDANGIGDICLELHSNKSNKRYLLEELRRTWDLKKPYGAEDGSLIRQLRQNRDQLNAHVARLHRRQMPSGLSPYQAMGHLVRLKQSGQGPAEVRLVNPESWSKPDREERELQLKDLATRIEDIGAPAQHPWWGAGIKAITPMDLERLVGRLKGLDDRVHSFIADDDELAKAMAIVPSKTMEETEELTRIGQRVAEAPELDKAAIVDGCWSSQTAAIDHLVSSGEKLTALLRELAGIVKPDARNMDMVRASEELSAFGAAWLACLESTYPGLRSNLAEFLKHFDALQSILGTSLPATLDDAQWLLALVQRVEQAPELDPDAMASKVWADRLPDITDLLSTGETHAAIRKELEAVFTDVAWETDLRQARQHLAAHGTSWFRFLNGDYKRAKLLLKSVMAGEFPKKLDEQLKLLDRLMTGQKAASALKEDDDLGRAAYGSLWRREKSDWASLGVIATWVKGNGGGDLGREIRRVASGNARTTVTTLAKQVSDSHAQLGVNLGALLPKLRHTAPMAFPENEIGSLPLLPFTEQLDKLDVSAAYLSLIFASPPATADAQRGALQKLAEVQSLALAVAAPDQETGKLFGQRAFGAAWNGEMSDWQHLRRIVIWNAENGSADDAEEIRQALADTEDKVRVGALVSSLRTSEPEIVSRAEKEFQYLSFDPITVFGSDQTRGLDLHALIARLDLWIDRSEDLTKWTAYTARAQLARDAGLGELVDRLANGRLNGRTVIPEFEAAYYEVLFSEMAKDDPELARFDGDGHSRMVSEFSTLDRKRIHLARKEVAAAHHQRIPRQDGGAGPIGLLKGEIVKRRNHLPIRQLMSRAGPAIQAIKPVFMMSPLSVAQFLEPGAVEFDVLVIDEASQIQPVDAFGAIARCKQVIVVGDDRQLPPTRFFDKMIAGADDEDDDEAMRVADVESILGLCVSKGLPQRMLRWHYRSRHQSLIAVSNSQFYENKLYIVPSPYTAEAGMGLHFHYLPHAVYDRGATATNVEEAKAVAKAIIEHAREHPDLSLGVATFSTKQRRTIIDELERLRRLNPEAEPFFTAHPAEPFFVKNLENVQGDERDVIFISVCYGKDASGFMNMGFGPLSRDGGERRLNVLISRAKRRCEVFSSITDEDIDLDRAKSKGVFAFKLFLHFARTGNLSFGHKSDREHDSIFEEQVANALRAHGYNVHPQVGLAGFFIDLAVADESRPGRYIIGIECDGASYHSSRSARDRDRLRQAVLEDHGWIIHRIWSTDWFNRPQQQLQKTIAAIEAAKAELNDRLGSAGSRKRAVPVEIVTVEREEVTEIGIEHTDGETGTNVASKLSVPYVEAAFPVPNQSELHEVPSGLMAVLVKKVVEVEGPVHGDEVVARLRTLWGLRRAGNRIRPAVYAGLNAAADAKELVADGNFFSMPDGAVTVRDRSSVSQPASGLRDPAMLPPAEIRQAAMSFVKAHLGATEEEIITGVSRLLGFKATSAQLRQALEQELKAIVEAGDLVHQGNLLKLKDS